MPRQARSVPFALALGASLAGHVALAAFWIVERSHPPEEPAPTETHSAPMTGESFDIAQTDEPTEAPAADPSPAIEFPANEPAAAPSLASGEGTSAPRPAHASTSAAPPTAAPPQAASPGSFGAVGERGAVEIVPFFQRAFVQMASADPAWANAPFGSAGTTSLSLTIDSTGTPVRIGLRRRSGRRPREQHHAHPAFARASLVHRRRREVRPPPERTRHERRGPRRASRRCLRPRRHEFGHGSERHGLVRASERKTRRPLDRRRQRKVSGPSTP